MMEKLIKMKFEKSNNESVDKDYFLILESFKCDKALIEKAFGNLRNTPSDSYGTLYNMYVEYYKDGGVFEQKYHKNMMIVVLIKES